jgi:SNF2 family DNA or RNA helicase
MMQAVLSALERFLQQEKVGHVLIDGSVTGKARNNLVTRFQEDDSVSTSTNL